jgi:hypothetical protein
MSFEDIGPYFRARIKEAGSFKEIDKPFDQSIPSTILDKSWTLVFDRITGNNRNMIDFHMVASIYINLYRKGYALESRAREEAAKDAEIIMKKCMAVSQANTQEAIKNVTMRSIALEPIPSNDNTVVARINFDVSIRINPNN